MRAPNLVAPIAIVAIHFYCSCASATTYNIPPDAAPPTTVSGDVINLNVGGSLPPNYSMVAGTTLNVDGGIYSPMPSMTPFMTSGDVSVFSTAGPGFMQVNGGTLNVHGGVLSAANIGGVVNLFDGLFNTLLVDNSVFTMHGGAIDVLDTPFQSQVEILGGAIGILFSPSGSEVHIRGGMIGDLESVANATVFMTGGAVDSALILTDTVMEVSGGTLGENFEAILDSELHLFGTEFTLNGQPIPGLLPGQSIVVPQRDVAIDGLLLDGTPVNLFLSTNMDSGQFFSSDSTLRLTLVPEAATVLLTIQALILGSAVRHRSARH